MNIQKNHVVSLHYRLTTDTVDGDLIEETYGAEPLKFIFGIGMMLPSFEENLEQKVAGDTFSFVLEPQNAYGYFEDEAVVDIPISSFQDEDGNVDRSKLTVGSPINMMDNNNNSYQGTVQESKEESIVIDFNHPMAGYTLHFKGEVLEVREATDSEMDHGHIHE